MKKDSDVLPFHPKGRFSLKVLNQACLALKTALSGPSSDHPHPRWFIDRCTCPGGSFEVVRVNYRHRLVRTDDRQGWTLVHHYKYDKIRA